MRTSHFLAIALAVGAAAWVLSGQLGDDGPTAAGAAGAADGRRADERAPTRVRVAVSTARPYVVTLSVTGRTEAGREVALRAQTSGAIKAIEAREGAFVEEGEVVARIALDDRPERLARAEAMVERFRVAFEASSELAESGWRAETANAEARADLRDAHADLAAIRLDIERTEIRAPFAGVLDSLDVEVGDVVNGGFGGDGALGRIFDMDPLTVVAAVSEREVGRIAVGDVGRVRAISGDVVDGIVRFVGRVAEPETRTYRVELEIPNPDGAVPVGMTAHVLLALETVASHFVSPSALSLADDGSLGVKIVDADDTARFVKATIVAAGADGVWLAGLPDTVTLITVGHDYVAAGETVEPVTVEGSSFSEAS